MKTLGMIGGLSWVSSRTYYSVINKLINKRLGNNQSARMVLYSFNEADLALLSDSVNWSSVAKQLQSKLDLLKNAGAELGFIACNTAHLAVREPDFTSPLPFVHIADAVMTELKRLSVIKVGILGTSHTVSEGLYQPFLRKEGIDLILPSARIVEQLHAEITNKLCFDTVDELSIITFSEAVQYLEAAGATAIILGCTELGLLNHDAHFRVPLLDTALLHAERVVDLALQE